jgi:predicted RNase H-like HicB family nuclease
MEIFSLVDVSTHWWTIARFGGKKIYTPATEESVQPMATREEVYEILQGVEFTYKPRLGSSGFWVAYCEEVPEARTQGETEEEVKENLRDAVAFILEDYSTEQLKELREQVLMRKEPLIL